MNEAYSVLLNKTKHTKHTMSSRESPGERERETRVTLAKPKCNGPICTNGPSHTRFCISVPPEGKRFQVNRGGMLGSERPPFRGMAVRTMRPSWDITAAAAYHRGGQMPRVLPSIGKQ